MESAFDQKAADFKQKMVTILNQAALNLAISIGYRTGLFEVLADIGKPATLDAIAAKSGLFPRYVKEWLAVMVADQIVELRPLGEKENGYYLPAAHAACLVRSAGNQNLAVYSQEIPLLTTTAMDAVIEAFGHGQGLPYSIYHRFQAFMSELSNAKHRQILVDQFLPSVADGDLVEKLRRGINVCDIGCGEGVALLLMAEAFPKSRFTGVDISGEAIESANHSLDKRPIPNAEFIRRDVTSMQGDPDVAGRFDYVVAFDAIHDQRAPLQALEAIHGILIPGGLFSMIDIAAGSSLQDNIDHPMAPFLYTVSLMHCLPVGLYQEGEGLGMMWGKEKAAAYLRKAGFVQIDVHAMDHDPFNYHYLCKKPN